MRTIKFRAFHKEKKKMYRVLGLWPNDDGSCEIQGLHADFGNVDITGGRSGVVFELMQFTGLKDKNGKEIYELDWVEQNGNKFLVEWDELRAGFYPFVGNGLTEDEVEIVGNKYE